MPPLLPNLEALAARLPPRPLTRFAPSPTGYLHLGHIVNAIYVWGIARALGGRVLLRIEDHDRLRSRPAYDEALRDDLEWLGFRADGPRVARQSDEPEAYAAALAQLAASYHVYSCDCSRREIAASASDSGGEVRYPGTCRTRGLEASRGRSVRIEIDQGKEDFVDALLGKRSQDPSEQCGDLLLRDRDGQWTYQFAVTVDDCRQKIDLVIRGADLLSSTGRQIRLARMLGRAKPPVFLHHPILLKPGGEKLSKSSGDTGVRELRAAGTSPEDVIGRAAHAVGLLRAVEPIPADRVELLLRQ
jgi:glutamyl-Q tRNA(Asp) synthetase